VKAIRNKSRQDWRTPPEFIQAMARAGMPILLDAMASDDNALAERFYTEQDDAFGYVWPNGSFCNPPFGKTAQVVKHLASGNFHGSAYVLTPGDTSTRWFRELFGIACELVFLQPRISFWHPEEKKQGSPGFGCVLWVLKEGRTGGASCRVWNWKE